MIIQEQLAYAAIREPADRRGVPEAADLDDERGRRAAIREALAGGHGAARMIAAAASRCVKNRPSDDFSSALKASQPLGPRLKRWPRHLARSSKTVSIAGWGLAVMITILC
jgi:hypothetical protein